MPSSPLSLEALSGICGSISIASWVVVYIPQIIENFRRSSADGLALRFVIIWTLGDIFNVIGAVLQRVIPTMTILAIYYTFADAVLLGQCFYYLRKSILLESPADEPTPTNDPTSTSGPTPTHGPTSTNEPTSTIEDEAVQEEAPTEESPLLPHKRPSNIPAQPTVSDATPPPARGSFSSIRSHISNSRLDATHLSRATPFTPPQSSTPTESTMKSKSTLYALVFNIGAIILVCAAGVLGWWLSSRSSRVQYPGHHNHHHHDRHRSSPSTNDIPGHLVLNLWGQIFGYLCAVTYLWSRIPQIRLNYSRKNTKGFSVLFVLFSCVGNLTYVLSILAYEPGCVRFEGYDGVRGGCESGEWEGEYCQHILVNASWLIGAAGTLLMDLIVCTQVWIYRDWKPEGA